MVTVVTVGLQFNTIPAPTYFTKTCLYLSCASYRQALVNVCDFAVLQNDQHCHESVIVCPPYSPLLPSVYDFPSLPLPPHTPEACMYTKAFIT